MNGDKGSVGFAPHDDLTADELAARFTSWAEEPASVPREPFWLWPIGEPRDRHAAAMLDAVRRGTPEFREGVAGSLSYRGSNTLGTIAARLAILAVRKRDRRHLERATLALALAIQGTDDYRDVIRYDPLVVHSARLIGVNPGTLYHAVAAWAPAEGAAYLRRQSLTTGAPLVPLPGRRVGEYLEGLAPDGKFTYQRAPPSPSQTSQGVLALNRAGDGDIAGGFTNGAGRSESFDNDLERVLDTTYRLTIDGRLAVARALDTSGRNALVDFARYASERAIGEGATAHLTRALRALGLALESAPDDATAGAALAFPWFAARRLGLDAASTVEAAAVEAPRAGAAALRRLAAAGTDLAATGFVEGADEIGFRFVESPVG